NLPDILMQPSGPFYIYKKSLIENIQFPERSVAEDIVFFTNVLLKAKSISFMREPLYHYRLNPKSIQSNPKALLNGFENLKLLSPVINNAPDLIKQYYEINKFCIVLHILNKSRLILLNKKLFCYKMYKGISHFLNDYPVKLTNEMELRKAWFTCDFERINLIKNCKNYFSFRLLLSTKFQRLKILAYTKLKSLHKKNNKSLKKYDKKIKTAIYLHKWAKQFHTNTKPSKLIRIDRKNQNGQKTRSLRIFNIVILTRISNDRCAKFKLFNIPIFGKTIKSATPKPIKKDTVSISYNASRKELTIITTPSPLCSYMANSCYLFLLAWDKIKENIAKNFSVDIYCEDVPKTMNENTFYISAPNNPRITLIPDPMFNRWVEVGIFDHDTTCRKIEEKGANKPIYNKMLWIGNTITNPIRKKLVEEYGQNSNFEFIAMDWYNVKSNKMGTPTKYISLEDHTKYKYLLDLPGRGWSARVKNLMFSQRPLFLVDREMYDYVYLKLKKYVHYIPVKADLSDLEAQYEWAESHPKEAENIAKNALSFAKKNLYMHQVIDEYSMILEDYIRNYK
ncbi:MAG: hypothetical protein HUJ63_10300, partial [Enterococcus sp.]|nr:hypothetical protein [Enterococcus sp.]